MHIITVVAQCCRACTRLFLPCSIPDTQAATTVCTLKMPMTTNILQHWKHLALRLPMLVDHELAALEETCWTADSRNMRHFVTPPSQCSPMLIAYRLHCHLQVACTWMPMVERCSQSFIHPSPICTLKPQTAYLMKTPTTRTRPSSPSAAVSPTPQPDQPSPAHIKIEHVDIDLMLDNSGDNDVVPPDVHTPRTVTCHGV